jgi:hypothetical protein
VIGSHNIPPLDAVETMAPGSLCAKCREPPMGEPAKWHSRLSATGPSRSKKQCRNRRCFMSLEN